MKNAGQSCWLDCNKQQGKCEWCGTEGYCCMKDWPAGNGCDGSFGGENGHECLLRPTKGTVTE